MKARALKTITGVMLAAGTGQAIAAGFQSTTHSAAGVGRANAGEAVIADNASVIARNPAAIANAVREVMAADYPPLDVAKTVERFSWNANAEALARYYESLIG